MLPTPVRSLLRFARAALGADRVEVDLGSGFEGPDGPAEGGEGGGPEVRLRVVLGRGAPVDERALTSLTEAIRSVVTTQQALLLEAARLRILLDGLDAGVLVQDEYGRVRYANPRLTTLLGLAVPPGSLAGADAAGALRAAFADGPSFAGRAEAIARGGAPVAGEILALAGGGSVSRDALPLALDGADRGVAWVYRPRA